MIVWAGLVTIAPSMSDVPDSRDNKCVFLINSAASGLCHSGTGWAKKTGEEDSSDDIT